MFMACAFTTREIDWQLEAGGKESWFADWTAATDDSQRLQHSRYWPAEALPFQLLTTFPSPTTAFPRGHAVVTALF